MPAASPLPLPGVVWAEGRDPTRHLLASSLLRPRLQPPPSPSRCLLSSVLPSLPRRPPLRPAPGAEPPSGPPLCARGALKLAPGTRRWGGDSSARGKAKPKGQTPAKASPSRRLLSWTDARSRPRTPLELPPAPLEGSGAGRSEGKGFCRPLLLFAWDLFFPVPFGKSRFCFSFSRRG